MYLKTLVHSGVEDSFLLSVTPLHVLEGRNLQLHSCDNLETKKCWVSTLCAYNGDPQLSRDFILPPSLLHFGTSCLCLRNTFTNFVLLNF